jgi:signal transduction histidine kinase
MSSILNWRMVMVICAMAIVTMSVLFINKLSTRIAIEESNRIKHYGLAIETLTRNLSDNTDANLATTIIRDNTTIPVILTDEKGNINDTLNVNAKSKEDLQEQLQTYKLLHKPIVVELENKQFVYFGESKILHQLHYFPYLLFAIIFVFIIVVFYAYRSSSNALQNRVWVGMSKETAHQLGTPLMSLVGWVEHLKASENSNIAIEMEKDIDRLQLVADRFSKIGSVPQLEQENIIIRLTNIMDYMRKRSPKNVTINLITKDDDVPIMLNGPLFDWVIENLIRNALDAMEGKGQIKIEVINLPAEVIVELSDTGKGMLPNQFKKVFKPGFTTKKRGWGLGLSLAKRIINKYHHGNIIVAKSEVGVGTMFRITLKR